MVWREKEREKVQVDNLTLRMQVLTSTREIIKFKACTIFPKEVLA